MSVEFTETTDEPEDSSSLIDEPPITVEPELIIFEPRPQGVRTALLLLTNTTGSRLIFKASISAKSNEIAYKICPCFDYIQPEDSRMLRISISTPTKPNKTHGFIYETLPLSNMQGYGIAASQYWNENDLDQKEKYLGTFVCREAESKTGYSLQYNRRLTFEDTAPVSFNDSTDSDDHAPQTCDIKSYAEMLDQAMNEMGRMKKTSQPPAYFWKNADGMRGFLLGFLSASVVFVFYSILKIQ